MGRVTDISDLTELETVRQEAAGSPIWNGGGSGGDSGTEKKDPPAPIPLPIEEPEEADPEDPNAADPEDPNAADPEDPAEVDPPEVDPAANENQEAPLDIVHDHDGDETTELTSVTETIVLEDVEQGQTYQLSCTGDGADNVVWSSDNAQVASVDPATGLVTFTGIEGDVTIRLYANDNSGVVADSVAFSSVAAAPAETEAPEQPAAADSFGIWPIVLIGLLSVVIIILLIMRSVEKKRRKAAARKRARRRNQSSEHTLVQQGAVATPMDVPMEDSVTAVQPHAGVRSAVFQAVGARSDQQDSYGMTDPALYAQQGILALVADGMGGLANGKAVSGTLVNSFLAEYRAMAERDLPQDALMKLSINANQRINQMLMGAERSGSTLVSVIIRDGCLYFLTVGDSRIYLYRRGALLQLNREHIYQEELAVKAVNCQIPISQVTGDRQAHALTSFFGSGSINHMDRNYEGIRLVPGDRVLLCSDGVFGTLTQAQMEYALTNDVKAAADLMKDMVRDAGKPHQDNNTGLILEYLG